MRRPRPELIALGLLVVAGVGLRVWLAVSWRPGYLGFSDSTGFLQAADGNVAGVLLRPPGYPVFLTAIRWIDGGVGWITLLQHAMGIASAVVLWLTCRRLSLPQSAGLAGAAALLLLGIAIMLEHAVLAETLFTLLLCVGALFAALALEQDGTARRRLFWAVATGATFGAAATVRTLALPLAAVAGLFVLLASGGSWRGRIAATAALGVAALAFVVADLAAVHGHVRIYSFAANDAYQSYGRVAPFADCRVLDIPARVRVLCPEGDARDRPGPGWWLYDNHSAIYKSLPGPNTRPLTAQESGDLRTFFRAAVTQQPRAYLAAVWRDMRRIVDPGLPFSPNPAIGSLGAGYRPDEFVAQLQSPAFEAGARGVDPRAAVTRRGTSFDGYERIARIDGWVLGVVIGLALLSPLAVRGRARIGAGLLLAVAVTLLVFPIMTLSYNWRYVAPTEPFLVAGAAATVAMAIRAVVGRTASRSSGAAVASRRGRAAQAGGSNPKGT